MGSYEEKDLPRESSTQVRTLVREDRSTGLSPWKAAWLCPSRPKCQISPGSPWAKWETVSLFCLTLFVVQWDSAWWISSVSTSVFALPHGRVHVECCYKTWSSGIAQLLQCVFLSAVRKRCRQCQKAQSIWIATEAPVVHINPAVQMVPIIWSSLSLAMLFEPQVSGMPWMGTSTLSPQTYHLYSLWSLLLLQGNGNLNRF